MNATELHARPSANFEDKLAQTTELLRQAARDFAPAKPGATSLVSQASSLGGEDMVITHLINQLELNIGIFVLDTGRLHAQTLALMHQLKNSSRAPVEIFHPQTEAVVQFVTREGLDPMYRSVELRKACCHLRKMEPLERALAGKDAWITGLRREQSGARANVPLIDHSDTRRLKFNPLAEWSWGDVWHYIQTHAVVYNALHDEFYPSIGCEPCTRAISLGEDFRSGRWWWESEDLKECGLHVKPHSSHEVAVTQSDTHGIFVSAQAHIAASDVKPEGRAEAKTVSEKNLGAPA